MSSEAQPFKIDVMELGPMENFIYLIQDRPTGQVLFVGRVVDPS